MNQLIRACTTAALAAGLAFTASVAVDDTAEGGQPYPPYLGYSRGDVGPYGRTCFTSSVWFEGTPFCTSWGPYPPVMGCGSDRIWDGRECITFAEYNARRTGASTHSGGGSCRDWTRDPNDPADVRVDPCATGGGGDSGGSGETGPSFWEWLLWSQDR